MTTLLFKFVVNFFAIVVLAIAIDKIKVQLAEYLVRDENEACIYDTEYGISALNTLSLTFAAAINAYAFTKCSSYHLTVVSIAYLLDLGALLYFYQEHSREGDYHIIAKRRVPK